MSIAFAFRNLPFSPSSFVQGPFSFRVSFLSSCSLMFTQPGHITFFSVSLLHYMLSIHGPSVMSSLLHPYQLLARVIWWQTGTEVRVNADIHANFSSCNGGAELSWS